jgi:hypothetical protein
MPILQSDLFDEAFSKPLFSYFHFSKWPVRFMLHYHIAKNPHFDLRLQFGNSLLSFAIYEQPFIEFKKSKCTRVKDHDLKTFTREGWIADGPGKGANVISDIGFYKIAGLPRIKGTSQLQKSLTRSDKLEIRFYGKKLNNYYSLKNTGGYKHDNQIWELEKPDNHLVIHDLTRSIITDCKPKDYEPAMDFLDPDLARNRIEIITAQILRDNNLVYG